MSPTLSVATETAPAQPGFGSGSLAAEPAANEEPALLTVSVSSFARRRLAEATRNSFWTADLLVERLLVDQLHNAYPVIRYRTVDLAPVGTFRAFDRRSHRPSLVFLASTGRYLISVRPENTDFQKLRQSYLGRGAADAEGEASEMCLFKLQTYLEDCSEEDKIIYPEDFLVRQIVERPADAVVAAETQAGANAPSECV